MSFQIKQGLFKHDIIDYHAVLGLPVDADTKLIRQQSLKIVYRLHPDTCKAQTKEEKDRANQLLSKLVNPAYQELQQDKSRAEHQLLLSEMGKRLALDSKEIALVSETSKQLAKAGADLDFVYHQLVEEVASEQYDSLDEVVIKIAQLSEINLIYLRLKYTQSALKSNPSQSIVNSSQSVKDKKIEQQASVQSKNEPLEESVKSLAPVDNYIRRAQEYIAKNKLNEATLELRDAIKMAPQNSVCQSLMAKIYLQQNQLGMAKIHLNKALQLNPEDPLAIESKKELDKRMLAEDGKGQKAQKPKSKLWEMLTKKL